MSDIEKRRQQKQQDAGDGGADPEVTRFLRESHRAPGTPGYWDGLESRIMARVRESVRQSVRVSGSVPAVAVEWWQVLSGWVAPGAWAAGIAALVALGAMLQSRAAERRVAYASVLEASVAGTPAAVGGSGVDDEALRRPDRIARPSSSSSSGEASGSADARRRSSAGASDREAALRDLLAPR